VIEPAERNGIPASGLGNRVWSLFTERGIEVPSAETDLIESALLDSLAFVELIAGIEDEFGITIAFDRVDLDDFRSIERITRFIQLCNQA
jgi:acyl carrier protein